MQNNQKGFLLISIIFIMLLMAVSIFSINYYSTTQLRMASNHTSSVQTSYDLKAVVEQSLWELTKDLFWRTDAAGEDYPGNTSYTRIVRNSNTAPFNYPSDYDDAVTIQVTPKGSDQSFQKSFRYYAKGFAGTGSSGSSGDGGAATSAGLNKPSGIYLAPSGILYIADRSNNKIRKVDTSGTISTFAGTGSGGFSGDEGAATSAKLNKPYGIYLSPSGNAYIADTMNHRIRRVDKTSGIITTFAGKNSSGYDSDGGPATSSKLNEPRGLFVENYYLYIADTKNHRIRMVNSSGTIYTVAGDGHVDWDGGGPAPEKEDGGLATDAHLYEPNGIFKDTSGNLYIADTGYHKIRMVNTAGIIYTVAGTGISGDSGDGGPATSARLNSPVNVSVDKNGNIFIADRDSDKIRVVNKLDGNIYTLAGTDSSGDTMDQPAVLIALRKPAGIAIASSYSGTRIYISDKDNHRIKVLLLKTVYGL